VRYPAGVCGCSIRSARGADLLCLLDDPDAAVGEAVADTLGWYRDKTAREMLLRLCDHPADSVRELSARSLDYLSDAET
jgi:HEAT repeat protein